MLEANIFFKMKDFWMVVVLFTVLFYAKVYADDDVNGKQKMLTEPCKCVPANFCADHDSAVTGEGLLDIRLKTEICSNYFEVCCKTLIQLAPETHDTVFKGCGYSNPMQTTLISRSISQDEYHERTGVNKHLASRLKHLIARSLDFTTRITEQSMIAKYGELPWSAVILMKDNGDLPRNLYKCGGSIIHQKVILTAAHCIIGIDQNYMTVRVGEWNTKTQDEPFPHQDIQVEDMLIHPYFHSGSLKNDIGLVFLKRPIVLNANIGIVCLPSTNLKLEPMMCIASGWGKDAFKNGKHAFILKKVDLPLVERDKCIADLRRTRLGPFYNLDQSFVCAGGVKGKDTCKGDGGSPLVCPIPGSENRYFQMGIVSWGIGCGEDLPGVYVNVPFFSNWIDKQLIARKLDNSLYKY